MNVRQYMKMLNTIIKKAPIESGVQTLVYMFLYDLVENINYDLVVIDNLNKKSVYASYAGISDIAIVKESFGYNEKNNEGIELCIEVKATNEELNNHLEQLLGQLLTYKKAILTNGKKWYFYDIDDYMDKNSNNDIVNLWTKNEFEVLHNNIKEIIKYERELASIKSSYAHTRKAALKQKLKTEKEYLEKLVNEGRKKVKENNQWINDISDNPKWTVNLMCDEEDEEISNERYIELVQKLYGEFGCL